MLYFMVPQQTGSPFMRRAQLSTVATAMSRAGPRVGGTARLPLFSLPQQVTVSSSWMAQAWLGLPGASGSLLLPWKVPAMIFAFRPAGGMGGLMPQQTTLSSSLMAQLKNEATIRTLARRPSGARKLVPPWPQQVTEW